MREWRKSGSVRGAPGDGCPYRDVVKSSIICNLFVTNKLIFQKYFSSVPSFPWCPKTAVVFS